MFVVRHYRAEVCAAWDDPPLKLAVLLSSPRRLRACMRSAVRHAIAWMVREGLAPPTVGKTEPSQIQRLGISQLRQSPSTTLDDGSLPIRAVPLRWQVSSSCVQMSRASTARSASVMNLSEWSINRLSLSHQE